MPSRARLIPITAANAAMSPMIARAGHQSRLEGSGASAITVAPELLERLAPERRQIVQPLQLLPREPNKNP